MGTKKENFVTINLGDIESVAAAIRDGITTVELMAEYLDVDLVEDCLVLPGARWVCTEADAPSDEETYPASMDAEEAAQEYVSTVTWGDGSEPVDVCVRVGLQAITEEGEVTSVAEQHVEVHIEAEEPHCVHEDGHGWKADPALDGHVDEVCGHCGRGRDMDRHSEVTRYYSAAEVEDKRIPD